MRDFAILVPSFNSARTVAETLVSIQLQCAGLERIASVMLSDDASTDDTLTVAEECWSSNVPLHVRRQPRRTGECGNVNAAVTSLDPEVKWLLILHSDDIAKPEWLGTMIHAADSAPTNVASITASWDVLLPDGRILPGEERDPAQTSIVPGDAHSIQSWVLDGCWWKITSGCIRRDVFMQVGGLDPSYRHMPDVEFILRVLQSGYDVLYVPASLSLYRVHDTSVTANGLRQNYDLIYDFRIFRSFMRCYQPGQKKRGYYLRVHASASRVLDSLRQRQFRRAAGALGVGAAIIGCYLRDSLTPEGV
jgi:GT2 family glycosyltransferase